MPILGDKNKAKQIIKLSINLDNCYFVEDGSELVGFLAFQNSKTVFLSPSLKDLISVYGVIVGIMKVISLLILNHKTESEEIYIDSIAVSDSARGKGIGTKLVDTIIRFAVEEGYKTVSLQVIDTNTKAKKLYENIGFKVEKQYKTWPINKMFGWSFNEVYLMKKDIS